MSFLFAHNKRLLLYILFNYFGFILVLSLDIPYNLYTSSGSSLKELTNEIPIIVTKSQGKNTVDDSVYYMSRFQVGSDYVQANIDFNSPDSWINATASDINKLSYSESGKLTAKKFSYEGVSGVWGSETILILSHTIEKAPVGVVNNSKLLPGSIGLGGYSKSAIHTNLRKLLQRKKAISASSYSIIVQKDGISGTVSFRSQADSSKYMGTLSTFTIPTTDKKVMFPLNGIYFNYHSNSNATVISTAQSNVIFDRSRELIYLPENMVKALISKLHITSSTVSFDRNLGIYLINNCPSSSSFNGEFLTFKLQNTDINVPLLSLFAEVKYENGEPYSSEKKCGFKVAVEKSAINKNHITLGNAFLRYVYQFNDYDLGKISIAQANVDKTSYDFISNSMNSQYLMHAQHSGSSIVSHSSSTGLNKSHTTSHHPHSSPHSIITSTHQIQPTGYLNASSLVATRKHKSTTVPRLKTQSNATIDHVTTYGAYGVSGTNSPTFTSHTHSKTLNKTSSGLRSHGAAATNASATVRHISTSKTHSSTTLGAYGVTSSSTSLGAYGVPSSTISSGSKPSTSKAAFSAHANMTSNSVATSSSNSMTLGISKSSSTSQTQGGTSNVLLTDSLATKHSSTLAGVASTSTPATFSSSFSSGLSSLTSSVVNSSSTAPVQTYTFANSEYSSIMSVISGNAGQKIIHQSVLSIIFYLFLNCII